jgi:hypothetical protein
MAKTKKKAPAMPANEPDPALMCRMLGSAQDGAPSLVVWLEMSQWKIDWRNFWSGYAKKLCMLSHVFRDLMRQEATCEPFFYTPPKQEGLKPPNPLFGETEPHPYPEPRPEQLYNLTRLWQVAGEPADKLPAQWDFGPEHNVTLDRGEAGVWADWESACWYCQSLDERIEVVELASVMY